MDFWESFWLMIRWIYWSFVFIAYLMILFHIIVDIVRDTTMRGLVKAVWFLFLLFFPFITAFVYLIARGDGMSKRSAEAARQSKQASEDYVRSLAGTSSVAEIEKAAALRDSGVISEEEFAQLKAKALAS